MSEELIPSVKGITKALETGIKLAKRISRSAESSSAEKSPEIIEVAQKLQKALEADSQAIRNVYLHAERACGESFNKTLLENRMCYLN